MRKKKKSNRVLALQLGAALTIVMLPSLMNRQTKKRRRKPSTSIGLGMVSSLMVSMYILMLSDWPTKLIQMVVFWLRIVSFLACFLILFQLLTNKLLSSSKGVHVMDPNAKDGLYPFRDSTKILRRGSTITLEGTSTLAGSAVDMTTCVKNLAKFANISLSSSIACATLNPAKCLGGEVEKLKGDLRSGSDADLVVVDDKGNLLATWVKGKLVFERK